MKPLVALLFASLVSAGAMAADAPAAPKVDVAKGAESYAAICVACHGADGNSAVPLQASLAQQHPEYLHKQLMEFKSGARQDPIMQGFAAALSEEDSRNISWWLASQKAKPGVATQPELVVMGERIYRGGIPDRHIPACAGCHSPNGAGIPSQYPRLSGQHAEYTVKQMAAFRDGTRANNAVMQGVAARMNDREIKAVSDYIAGLR
jgi:cytochrome c553